MIINTNTSLLSLKVKYTQQKIQFIRDFKYPENKDKNAMKYFFYFYFQFNLRIFQDLFFLDFRYICLKKLYLILSVSKLTHFSWKKVTKNLKMSNKSKTAE